MMNSGAKGRQFFFENDHFFFTKSMANDDFLNPSTR